MSVLWASKAGLREIKLPYGLLCYFKARVCSFFHIKILSNIQIQESKAFADGFVSLAL